MNTKKVLFLCTGNSARSQMAEALLRFHAGNHFQVFSAGLEPRGLHPFTIRVMEEIGIEMSGYRSKHLQEYYGREDFDYLITVCNHADENCPVFPGSGQRLHWDFEDPAKMSGNDQLRLEKFREIRNRIDEKILDWLKQMGIQANQ